jgi:hypothetical protein
MPIGDHPVHMGGWEKAGARLALATTSRVLALGAARDGGTRPLRKARHVDAIRRFVSICPTSRKRSHRPFPVDGNDPNYFYSGQGDNLDNLMTNPSPPPRRHRSPSARCGTSRADWDYALSRGSGERRVADGSDQRVPEHQSERPELRLWHQRASTRNWTTVTATLPAGTNVVRVPLLDRRPFVRGRVCGRLHLSRRSRRQRDHHHGWTACGIPTADERPVQRRRSSTTTWRNRAAISEAITSLCGAYNFLVGNWLEKQCYRGRLVDLVSQLVGDGQQQYVSASRLRANPPDSTRTPRPSPCRTGNRSGAARWQTWDATFGADTTPSPLSQVAKSGRH